MTWIPSIIKEFADICGQRNLHPNSRDTNEELLERVKANLRVPRAWALMIAFTVGFFLGFINVIAQSSPVHFAISHRLGLQKYHFKLSMRLFYIMNQALLQLDLTGVTSRLKIKMYCYAQSEAWSWLSRNHCILHPLLQICIFDESRWLFYCFRKQRNHFFISTQRNMIKWTAFLRDRFWYPVNER